MKEPFSVSDDNRRVSSPAPRRPIQAPFKACEDRGAEKDFLNTDFGRVLFDQLTGYAIIAADFDGNVIAFNEGARRIFEYDPEDVVTKLRVDAFFSDEFLETGRLRDAIAEALAGKEFSSDGTMLRRGGKTFPAHVIMAATRGRAGRIIGFVVLVEDLTERKKAQDKIERMNAELDQRVRLRTAELQAANLKLEESERKFRAILETALDGIVLVDMETGKFLMGNPAMCHMLGYSADDLVGLAVDDIHSPTAISALKMVLYHGPLGEARLEDVEVVRRDGSSVFADIVTSPMMLGERKFRVAVMHDVTERKRQEGRIREEAEKFRAVVEQNVAGISIISQEGRFIYTNPFVSAALGYAPHELIGRKVVEFIADSEREQNRQFHREHPYGAPGLVQFTGAAVSKDGRRIEVLANESGIIYDGKPAELAVMIDISGRKNAEAALRRSLHGTISAIVSTLEMRDPFTGGHQRRVADLSAAIAREMGLSDHAIEGISLAAAVHDIGKVSVPAELLSYPGKLTPKQFALIQEHARAGYEILKDIEFPWPVATIVLEHHERLDGSGYPGGLKGDAIILEAKILAVADVVEAMMSHRPYRPALGLDAALDEIEKGKGRLYEPAAVDACLRLFRAKGFSFADKAIV